MRPRGTTLRLRLRGRDRRRYRHAYLLSSSPQQALSRVGISAADEGAQVLALRVALGRTGVADIPAGTDISRELAPNLALWRDAGLDSIRLLMPRGDPLLAVFNPRNIRSVNAQFDPRRAGSRDILAGIGGGVVAAEASGAGPSSEPGSPP